MLVGPSLFEGGGLVQRLMAQNLDNLSLQRSGGGELRGRHSSPTLLPVKIRESLRSIEGGIRRRLSLLWSRWRSGSELFTGYRGQGAVAVSRVPIDQ